MTGKEEAGKEAKRLAGVGGAPGLEGAGESMLVKMLYFSLSVKAGF